MLKIALQIIIISCLISCVNNNKHNKSDEWGSTNWVNLEQENIKLRIPLNLKKSSRYRIKEDLPILAKDSIKLRLVQNSLELLEFEDSEIDVFIDTSKTYRMVIICNTQRIDFNKTDASILKKELMSNNEKSALSNPNLEYSEINAKMKANSKHKMVRYTTQIQNKLDNSNVYNSIYYLTGDSYSLVVYEFSEDNEMIEKYLWTAKTG